MMNIRDYIFINKAKNVNKIRILDILGFESNTFITQTPETIKPIVDNEKIEIDEIKDDIQVNEDIKYSTYDNIFENSNLIENASTETFQPIKVTSRIKKIWTDIETRRQWVVPVILIVTTLILITSVTTIFINNRNSSRDVEILYETLSIDANNLIDELPNIINISTDNFYSKYDVSNSSANLQIIESTIMEYDRNLTNREGFADNLELSNNLNNIFTLIDDLDDLISYRILRSEILIYNDTLIVDDKLDIDFLSTQLSEISAKSKRNFENLPIIDEFDNHYLLLKETLTSAEDLHGRLIAALRNNEYELANTLIVAINMNKEIENSSFSKSLLEFKINKSKIYNDIEKLP